MKRTDRGFDTGQPGRDAAAKGPLQVEPLAPQGRRTHRFGLPLFLGLVVVIALVAMTSRFAAYFAEPTGIAGTTGSPTPHPLIAWVDTTVAAPAPLDSLPLTSQVRVRSVRTTIVRGYYFSQGAAGHFTVDLTNTTGASIPLSPCPTYRIFVIPDDGRAPERYLNCAAIQAAVGLELSDGQTVSLDMVFTPTVADPVGPQQLEWSWQSPSGYQAVALRNVYITP